jgi:O-phospho-L-seryl-tRNASec:L-selenocysteinyl-tRNA synthase
VWSRIDQKTCLKSILAANLTPLVVPLLAHGDQVVTDVVGIQAAVEGVGPANVAAVVTTTSCFAPRCVSFIGLSQILAVCLHCNLVLSHRAYSDALCGCTVSHLHQRGTAPACCLYTV